MASSEMHSSPSGGWSPERLEFPNGHFPAAHREGAREQEGQPCSASRGPACRLFCPARVSWDAKHSAPCNSLSGTQRNLAREVLGGGPVHQRMLLPVWGRCDQPASGPSRVGPGGSGWGRGTGASFPGRSLSVPGKPAHPTFFWNTLLSVVLPGASCPPSTIRPPPPAPSCN